MTKPEMIELIKDLVHELENVVEIDPDLRERIESAIGSK